MKITFIRPAIGRREHSLYVDEGRMEPLTLGVLAGMTPPDVECVLYDDRMETIPYDESTDLVAITIEIYTARRAYEICAEYRQRGVKVIAGGVHTTLMTDEVREQVDSVFTGDAETAWPAVVEDARRGRLQAEYHAPTGIGQLGGYLPRRDLYEGKGYLPVTLIQFSRGCPYACNFCAVTDFFDARHHVRRVEEVVREIENQERNFLFFVDDNVSANKGALRELCEALIPLKVKWVSQASLELTHDEELMDLVRRSGCIGNVIGFESINDASLREMHKFPNITHNFQCYAPEIATLRRYGMQTWAAFVLGFDSDTPDSVEATLEFALKNRFAFAAFNILMPYPRTALYERLKAEDRLLYDGKWWLHPEYRLNMPAFIPAQMSARELADACDHAREKFNSIPSLLYRLADLKTNLRTLWRARSLLYYSRVFRRELRNKQHMHFGAR